MDYFILCFGRTDFTRMTVDAIRANARVPPKITLINNGWNSRFVPPQILKYWTDFTQAYLDGGQIHAVHEIDAPVIGRALDAFAAPALDGAGRYYFITDNDCVVDNRGRGDCFDDYAVGRMDAHPELQKLGAFLYIQISLAHCRQFPVFADSPAGGLADYLPIDFDGDPSFARTPDGMKDLAAYRGQARTVDAADPCIAHMPVDTTFSILRSPCRVTQANRLSPTLLGFEILHVGFFEPYFFNQSSTLSNMEFVYYQLLRPKVLTEFAEVYAKRCARYLANLAKAGHSELVGETDSLIRSNWR